jgi:hypothetical protein
MFDKVIGGNPDGSLSKVKGVVENWIPASELRRNFGDAALHPSEPRAGVS